jgi:hypothetical protein
MDGKASDHEAWLARVERRGLFVTARALEAAGAHITTPVGALAASLRGLSAEHGRVVDLHAFLRDVLGWSAEYLVPRAELPAALRVPIGQGEVVAPAYALRSAEEPGSFVFLVQEAEPGQGLTDGKIDAAQRFERLLRETGVAAGLLTDGYFFRLVHAPRGERAGSITFRLPDLLEDDAESLVRQVLDDSGAPLLGALHMLANEPRLLSLPPDKRLLGLLRASRAYKVARLGLRAFGAFEDVELPFAGGINVFIGANGTGKTHAMKALYAVLKPFEIASGALSLDVRILEKLANVFKPDEGQVSHLIRRPGPGEARIVVEGTAGKIDVTLHAAGPSPLTLESGSWQSASARRRCEARSRRKHTPWRRRWSWRSGASRCCGGTASTARPATTCWRRTSSPRGCASARPSRSSSPTARSRPTGSSSGTSRRPT